MRTLAVGQAIADGSLDRRAFKRWISQMLAIHRRLNKRQNRSATDEKAVANSARRRVKAWPRMARRIRGES